MGNEATRFQPGNPIHKPVGAINHQKRAMEWFLDHGFDWRKVAMERVMDQELPQASRDYALGLIVDRCAPKLKAVDITATGQSLQQVLINVVSGTNVTPDANLTVEHDPVDRQPRSIKRDPSTFSKYPATPWPDDLPKQSVDSAQTVGNDGKTVNDDYITSEHDE